MKISNPMLISIVIPTYSRRINMAVENATAIAKRLRDVIRFEILIVDSSETSYSESLCDEIRYINLDYKVDNLLTRKRNLGFLKSSGKKVIFIDDDVVVDHEFLHLVIKSELKGTILCGNIYYPPELTKLNPLIMYKDMRHRQVHASFMVKQSLAFNNFVAMCFAIAREDVFLFDESFNRYGCEDLDYGMRLEQKGIRILLAESSTCLHLEESVKLDEYKKKLYNTSRYMFPIFDSKYNFLNRPQKISIYCIGIVSIICNQVLLKAFDFVLQKRWFRLFHLYQYIVFAEGYTASKLHLNKKDNNEFI